MGSRSEMEMKMTETEIVQSEWQNTGTSWTRNQYLEENGFLVVKNICDPKKLFCPPPEKTGKYIWWGKEIDQFRYFEDEEQVNGSLARYWYPQYRKIHSDVRKILEEAIGRKLYNTYYYDRYYYPGQQLIKHTDRPACEISVSVHISTNIKEDWPIYFKTPDKFTDITKKELVKKGENVSVKLKQGDGVIYKGCERPHWRDSMPGLFEEMIGDEVFYYHQIFFHYVLQDGVRAHFAFDRGND